MKIKFSSIGSLPLLVCLLTLTGFSSSCNKKTESSTEDTYMPSSTAAVTSFKIKAKDTSLKLDSVFFSIDLNRGVIFNADSLPVGTDITKLVPTITYTSSASAVTLTVNSDGKDVESDYKTNPNDTIDFSNPVKLTVTAEDEITVRSYDIKVNVHTVQPDSLVWDKLAVTPLPSKLGKPKAQKTVKFKDTTYTLLQENDNSYSLSVASDILSGEWNLLSPRLDFQPNVETLNATPDRLCVLDISGVLHVSSDGITWSNTGLVWTNIIGAYGNALLGMRNDSGKLVHTSWSAEAGYKEQPVKENFPVSGYSDFVQFSNRWTTLPIGFMTGGRLADGSLTEMTWGFDGDNWEVLSENMVPKVEGASIVPYFVYRKTSSSLVQTEFSVWMLIGGQLEDGNFNKKIYVSYDNGVNWYAADTQMQLPDYFPGLYNLDAVMVEWPKQASLEGNWQLRAPRQQTPMARLKYNVDNYEVSWDCPYIYIFGGIDESGNLNDEVWRGVLNRLTFIPQF
ncbi:MAG: DUF6242 domain-containing protein [Muribaculum sp.]|nr:DUF6242 domain-containing protein [Muribaculum sp.]